MKETKTPYEKAEIEVLKFSSRDILTESFDEDDIEPGGWT